MIQTLSPYDELIQEQFHEIARPTILEFTSGEYELMIEAHVDVNIFITISFLILPIFILVNNLTGEWFPKRKQKGLYNI